MSLKEYFRRIVPDRLYLQYKFYKRMKMCLDLNNPRTFNQKLQWLKLYDRNPEYTKMVDKYEVKKYISEKIGEEYVIPTLGVWESPEEIDFDKLPDKFVLKCNHNSGLGMCICKDRRTLNVDKVKKDLKRGLAENYYWNGREWPYKNVKPRIIAEKYMEDNNTKELRDYKFFCFNGEPMYCQVISERTTNETIDFFDMLWNHQEFTGLGLPHKPFSKTPINQPVNFEKMKKFAKCLSDGIPFVRIDFYEVNNELYFGEITFFPAGGFGKFTPDEYNYLISSYLNLPKHKLNF